MNLKRRMTNVKFFLQIQFYKSVVLIIIMESPIVFQFNLYFQNINTYTEANIRLLKGLELNYEDDTGYRYDNVFIEENFDVKCFSKKYIEENEPKNVFLFLYSLSILLI